MSPMVLSVFFLEVAFEQPLRFVSILFTVVVSITLHELAHGWAALWQGDDTPRTRGHLTADPLVHMGWFSILLLLTVGIAYGLMPVNPAKFRNRRWGEALVALAGPAMNLLLAALALLVYALWIRYGGLLTDDAVTYLAGNTQRFLWWFGTTNLALVILNVLPIPPLDGSTVLASVWPAYDRMIRRTYDPTLFIVALLGVLVLLSVFDFGLFTAANHAALWFTELISGMDLQLSKSMAV